MGVGRGRLTRRTVFAAISTGYMVFGLSGSPAGAQIPTPPPGETSGGFGLAAGGAIDVAPTASVSCPPANQTASALSAAVGTLATAQALSAACNGTTASSGAASGTVLGLQFGAIESRCANGVGSSSVVRLGPNGGTFTGPITITVSPLATVKLNETTSNGSGETVQNAVHATVLDDPALLGDQSEEIIIGQSRCANGPTPVVPEAPMALLLPLSAVALFGGGFLVLRHRRTGPAAA